MESSLTDLSSVKSNQFLKFEIQTDLYWKHKVNAACACEQNRPRFSDIPLKPVGVVSSSRFTVNDKGFKGHSDNQQILQRTEVQNYNITVSHRILLDLYCFLIVLFHKYNKINQFCCLKEASCFCSNSHPLERQSN